MQIGGIGTLGTSGLFGIGGAMFSGGPAATQGTGAMTDPLGVSGASCANVEAPGMDVARFLLALMMLSALEKGEESKGPGAAGGFLAGLMLAGAFRDAGTCGFEGTMHGMSVGGMLDVQV